MASQSVGFAVADEDRPRLDRLVQRFGGGNRSAFLRVAIERLEVLDRAERLQRLQRYGAARSAERGLKPEDVDAIVDEVLKRHKV